MRKHRHPSIRHSTRWVWQPGHDDSNSRGCLTIAAAVCIALAAYKTDIPTPTRDDYPKLSLTRLRTAGVRSEKAFMRGARIVSIQKKEGFALIPHVNGGSSGPKRSFYELSLKMITLPDRVDGLALGAACIQALTLCE